MENNEYDEQEYSAEHAARQARIFQEQREARRKEMAKRRWLALLRFILILCIIFLTYKLVTTSHWYISKSAFNTPQNEFLKIQGNEIVPDYKILNALRRVELPHRPIYLINTDDMEDEVSKLDLIKRVYIRRFWFPGRFTVVVEERKPVLLISPSLEAPPVAFFAEGGNLIGREYLPLKKNYNMTLVLTYGTHGDDYKYWDEAKVKMLDKLAKTLTQDSGEKVLYIDLRNPKDAYVQLETVNLRLGELNNTVFKRIKSLNAILPQIQSFKNKIKYVDLRWEETKYLKLEYNNDENSTGTTE